MITPETIGFEQQDEKTFKLTFNEAELSIVNAALLDYKNKVHASFLRNFDEGKLELAAEKRKLNTMTIKLIERAALLEKGS